MRATLDMALDQMRKEQDESASAEDQLADLRRAAPDLAEMVEDERLTIAEALEKLSQRQRAVRLRIAEVRRAGLQRRCSAELYVSRQKLPSFVLSASLPVQPALPVIAPTWKCAVPAEYSATVLWPMPTPS